MTRQHTASRLQWLFFCGLACVLASSPAIGQDEKLDGEGQAEVTKDGWTVHFTYWEGGDDEDTPIVVLLHGRNENRLIWSARKTAQLLAQERYAVIAVDLRKHGETKAPEGAGGADKSSRVTKFDYERMVGMDLEAVKRFIYQEHQAKKLNMRKMAIVGSDMSTVVAMNYAALDWSKKPYDDAPTLATRTPRGQDTQAVVLLSPLESLSGLSVLNPIRFLRQTGMAALIMYGSDSGSRRTAAKIYQQMGGENQDEENQRLYQQAFDIKLQGTGLLGQGIGTEKLLVGFLKLHLRDKEIPWKDRKSRLAK